MPEAILWALVLVLACTAALRVAWRWVGGGWPRIAAAASLTGALAALVPVACGLAGIGAGPPALAAATVAVALPALLWAGRPGEGVLAEARRRRDGLPRPVALTAAGAAGTTVAFAVAGVLQPVIVADRFHLAEIVRWLHEGRPGSAEPVDYAFPNHGLALANELMLAWGIGISRTLSPVALLTAALLALLGGSLASLLRGRGLSPAAATAGAAAVWAVAVVSIQVDALNSDLGSLAWLAATAALAAHGRLGPAVLALGLAAGTKPTVTVIGLALVAPLAWRRRAEWGAGDGAATAAALALAAPWPLRSLIEHGSPLWPISSMGIGDPVPYIQSELQTAFLQRPAASVAMYWQEAPVAFLRALLVLGAGVAAVALVRRRDARVAMALAALGLLLWAQSPLSGASGLDGFADSYLRYLAAPVAAAALAVALAAGTSSRAARALLAGVALSAAYSLPAVLRPSAPGLLAVLGAGVAAGAVLPRLGPRAVAAGAAAGVAALAVISIDTYEPGREDPVYAYLASQAAFRDGDHPIVTELIPEGRWSGRGLRHDVQMLPAGRPCGDLRTRVERAWVVVHAPHARDAAFAGHPPHARPGATEPCLRGLRPRHDGGAFLVYSGVR